MQVNNNKEKTTTTDDIITTNDDYLYYSTNNNNNDKIDEGMVVEIRPMRRKDAIQAGLDYWMDESDIEKERLRRANWERKRRRNNIRRGGGGRIDSGVYGMTSTSSTEEKTNGGQQQQQQISIDKLKQEMVAPYKQNWIGFMSVGMILMSVIVTKFPELLMIPIIPLPDL